MARWLSSVSSPNRDSSTAGAARVVVMWCLSPVGTSYARQCRMRIKRRLRRGQFRGRRSMTGTAGSQPDASDRVLPLLRGDPPRLGDIALSGRLEVSDAGIVYAGVLADEP